MYPSLRARGVDSRGRACERPVWEEAALRPASETPDFKKHDRFVFPIFSAVFKTSGRLDAFEVEPDHVRLRIASKFFFKEICTSSIRALLPMLKIWE